jgi:hypothetical protein
VHRSEELIGGEAQVALPAADRQRNVAERDDLALGAVALDQDQARRRLAPGARRWAGAGPAVEPEVGLLGAAGGAQASAAAATAGAAATTATGVTGPREREAIEPEMAVCTASGTGCGAGVKNPAGRPEGIAGVRAVATAACRTSGDAAGPSARALWIRRRLWVKGRGRRACTLRPQIWQNSKPCPSPEPHRAHLPESRGSRSRR